MVGISEGVSFAGVGGSGGGGVLGAGASFGGGAAPVTERERYIYIYKPNNGKSPFSFALNVPHVLTDSYMYSKKTVFDSRPHLKDREVKSMNCLLSLSSFMIMCAKRHQWLSVNQYP